MASRWDQDGCEDASNSHVALDLTGRKHVDRSENADGVYWVQPGTPSSYFTFAMPGQASADALRNFLSGHLAPSVITNEYGHVTPIVDVASDYLPTFQSRLWHGESKDATTSSSSRPVGSQSSDSSHSFLAQYEMASIPPTPQPDVALEDRLLFACHVTLITDLLNSNHVFVLQDKSTNACGLVTCRMPSSELDRSAQLVTIEPLIHWGTLTPAPDTVLCCGRMLAFRRNGEMCKDPLWTQAVRGFTPSHPTTYCTECLESLMNKREIAWAEVERIRTVSFRAVNDQATRVSPSRVVQLHVKRSLKNTDQYSVVEKHPELRSPRCKMVSDRKQLASLSLDGTYDGVTNCKHDFDQGPGSVLDVHQVNQQCPNEKGHTYYDSSSARGSASVGSSGDRSPFTSFSKMSSASARPCEQTTNASAWATFNQPSFETSSPSTDQIHFDKDPQHTIVQKHRILGNSEQKRLDHTYHIEETVVVSSSPRRSHKTKRKFGREIDANAVIGALRKSMSSEPGMGLPKKDANEVVDIRSFFNPEALFERDNPNARTARAAMVPTFLPKHRQFISSWTTTDESIISEDGNAEAENAKAMAKVVTPRTIQTKPLPKIKPPPAPTIFKQTAKGKDDKTPPHLKPFFAKYTNLRPEAIPDTISEYTYRAHQARVPDAKECICSCRKPARTFEVQLAQCANAECMIVWYHYDCLDKSGKLKARHGTMVCQYCRNEQHFKDLEAQNGWSVEQLVQQEMSMPFSGKDILATLPGLGGGVGVVDPYGLGTMMAVQHGELETPKYAQGALGCLGFLGYPVSMPEVLSDAYMNGHVYRAAWQAREAEEAAEMADREEEEGEECEAGYYEECEEGLDAVVEDDCVEDAAEAMDLD